MAPTMAIETVQVVRPIKVIAFVCGIISVILLIVSVAANSWVEAKDFRQGLWSVCLYDEVGDVESCESPDSESKGWLLACGILSIISLLAAVVVTILTGVGLWSKDHTRKYTIYRAATFLMFAACGLQLVSLIVFPVMFIQGLDRRSLDLQINEWYFAWAYGVGWGAAIFELGAAILLLIDKDNEEIYYSEKTTYRENHS